MVRRALRGSKATRMLFAKKKLQEIRNRFSLKKEKKRKKEKDGTSLSSLSKGDSSFRLVRTS